MTLVVLGAAALRPHVPSIVHAQLHASRPINPVPMRASMTSLGGYPVVTATVDSRLVPLCLDTGSEASATGASATALRGRVVPRLTTLVHPGPVRARVAWAFEASLGTATIPPGLETILALPCEKHGIAGVIGMNVLGQQALLLDAGNGVAVFGEPMPEGMAEVAMSLEGLLPVVVATVDGRELRLLLDTGYDGGIFMRRRDAIACGGGTSALSDSIAGQVEVARGHVNVEMGAWKGTLSCQVPAEDPDRGTATWDGMVGMELLRTSRLWMDARAQRVALDVTAAPAADAP